MPKSRARKTRGGSLFTAAEQEKQLRAKWIKNGLTLGGPGGTRTNLDTGEEEPFEDEIHIPIPAKLYDKARALGWSSNQLIAEAMRLAHPEGCDIVCQVNPDLPAASPITHH